NYTIGKSAYGYHCLGDIFVFIVFGIFSFVGSYFLYTKELDWMLFLPTSSVGMFSVGLLNVNNMRVRESDKKSVKNTLVVKIGNKSARYYHYILLIAALFFSLVYSFIRFKLPVNFIFVIAFMPVLFHMLRVYKNK